MDKVHFLYPAWLLLIPVWLLCIYAYQRYQQKSVAWEDIVDPELQPIVISGNARRDKYKHLLLPLLSGLLILLALSGPSLHKENIPVFEVQHGLVIGLDLSTSMLAQDVEPSRLQRAKFEMLDLMNQRKEGQTGLVVFAGDAFVVAPMTTDVETIISQMNFLTPAVMPTQGSKLDRAIVEATDLLANSGYNKGHILLITDGLSHQTASVKAAQKAQEKGFTVSILAIGTPEGATVPLKDNGVLRDKEGKPVIAKLDDVALKTVSAAGKGIFLPFSIDDNDTHTLLEQYSIDKDFELNNSQEIEHWRNDGIWLLFPLLLVIIMFFRKGYFVLFALFVFSHSTEVYALDWNSLWLNQNQQGKKALTEGRSADAQKLFQDPEWKAAAAYRAKDYKTAERLYAAIDTLDGWYNRGNVLVQMNKLVEAVEAYQKVLSIDPEHEDAKYNLQLLIEVQQQKFSIALQNNSEQGEKNSDAGTSNGQGDAREGTDNLEQPPAEKELSEKEKEVRAYTRQWLKSIPDDPAGLWRKKFQYQYKKRGQQSEVEPW